MQAQLAELLERTHTQTATVEAWVGPRSDLELLRRPRPDAWCAVEHLQHLVLTNQAYLLTLDQALARARARRLTGEGPFAGGSLVNWFIRSLEPPVTRRVKTFRSVIPESDLDRAVVVRGFYESQAALMDGLTLADGLDLNRIKIRSPLLRLLKMNAYQGFRLVVVHNDRHLWHLEQILG